MTSRAMLNYLVTRRHTYTVRGWFRRFAGQLGGPARILTYERVGSARAPAASDVYVFSDLDRLHGALRDRAARFHERAVDAGSVVLNDPARFVRRRDLHRALGLRYRSFRASEALPEDLGPCFLRGEDDHDGPLTAVLPGRAAARRARLRHPGALVVELLDTADEDGVYRKYSAFRVGDAIVPRHLLFSRDWMVKHPDLLDPAYLEEELRYLYGNPHEDAVRRVFDVAGLRWGRIDYAVHDGAVQTWEINTNPLLVTPGGTAFAARRTAHVISARLLNGALARLSDRPRTGGE